MALVRQHVILEASPFGADNVWARFTVPADAPEEVRRVSAPWSGSARLEANGLISLEMDLQTLEEVRERLGEEVPVPQRMTFGPIRWNGQVSAPWKQEGRNILASLGEAGALLGSLEGTELRIALRDEHGAWLDPIGFMRRLHELGLWELAGAAEHPLVPPSASPEMLEIAGDPPLSPGAPYLRLWGGSRLGNLSIHNPPAVLPTRYFSFLSEDTVHLGVMNVPAGAACTFRMNDQTAEPYKSPPYWDIPTLPIGSAWSVVPQDVIRPFHLIYQKGKRIDENTWDDGNGKRTPGPALTYQLTVQVPGHGALLTTISQDERDVIRQEYVFHRPPYQIDVDDADSEGCSKLKILARDALEQLLKDSEHFKAADVGDDNNYWKAGEDGPKWAARPRETFEIAEQMRWHFQRRLTQAQQAETVPWHVFRELNINSSWRNPERNEAAGGVANSNHQEGRAVDLKPLAPAGPEVMSRLRDVLLNAARDLYTDLLAVNTPAACVRVEFLLEFYGSSLWRLYGEGGEVKDGKGGSYAKVFKNDPIARDSEDPYPHALAKATHFHIAWPSATSQALTLPARRPYPPIVDPAQRRHVILWGSNDPSVPEPQWLPLQYAARSLAEHLRKVDPQTPVVVASVRSPVELLRELGAFPDRAYAVKTLFLMCRASAEGDLQLLHFPHSTPYLDPDGNTDIHDEHIEWELREMHATKLQFETHKKATAGQPESHFRTDRLRMVNLNQLPQASRELLRERFRGTEGVFILASRSGTFPQQRSQKLNKALAQLLGTPVHGSDCYGLFYQWDDRLEEWGEYTDTASDMPPTDERPVLFLPSQQVRGFGPDLISQHTLGGSEPVNPESLPMGNVLRLYKRILLRSDPT